jgi:hypothetical protein
MLAKKLITGIFLLVADYVIEGVLYNGYIGNSIIYGNWGDYGRLWEYFFRIKTLEVIAWSMIITSIITYLLLRKDGVQKFKKNMIVYGIITVIILTMTNFVHNWVDQMPWQTFNGIGWPDNDVQILNASFKSWAMTNIAGNIEPLFPYLATASVGAMLGLALANPEKMKKLPLWGFTTSIVLILLGVILALVGIDFTFYFRPTISTFCIQLGGQLFLIILILRLVEYRGRGEKFANRRIVKITRRWGMIALSMYTLEIFDFIPELSLNLIVGNRRGLNFFDRIFGFETISYALLVGLYCMIWYEILVRLWSRINYIGSMEWLMIKLQIAGSKQSSQRLNTDLMLNKMEWESFNLLEKQKN